MMTNQFQLSNNEISFFKANHFLNSLLKSPFKNLRYLTKESFHSQKSGKYINKLNKNKLKNVIPSNNLLKITKNNIKTSIKTI
jgi:hypothetical protein